MLRGLERTSSSGTFLSTEGSAQHVQMMGKHLAGISTAAQLREALSAEARRAARILEGGLDLFALDEHGAGGQSPSLTAAV